MTTATIQKQVRRYPAFDGRLFRELVLRLMPRPIANEEMHRIYSKILDAIGILIAEDKITSKERGAIEAYFGAVSHFVAEYEGRKYPLPDVPPADILAFLMEQHDLTQTDLADDLGGQSVVSEILHGKRELTRDHIERLSRRFSVSPAVFFSKAA